MTTTLPPGASLITVLGADPEARAALCRALQARLVAREVVTLHQPCDAIPEPCPSGWLKDCLGALNAALVSCTLALHESSVVHAAAARQKVTSPELQTAAQAELARSAQVLLCAAPTQADAVMHALDGRLRQSLVEARTNFCVIHGTGAAAEAQAWQALCLAMGWPLDAEPDSAAVARRAIWRGACDKCSDPVCEHRVFSDLIAQRAGT